MIVGEAGTGQQALELIRSERPDLLFLDVQMPKLSGLELLQKLGEGAPPAVVFVTAHDAYAVQAFKHCAFDYLLKPFDQERFDQTVRRARERFQAQCDAALGQRVRSALGAVTDPVGLPPAPVPVKQTLTRFVVKEAGRVTFVPVEDTDWLEASGNYVAVHALGKTHLVYDTLSNVERQLAPQQFLRIHRCTIVNVARIKELQPFTNGEFIVILRDGTKLKLSRNYRERADGVLGLG